MRFVVIARKVWPAFRETPCAVIACTYIYDSHTRTILARTTDESLDSPENEIWVKKLRKGEFYVAIAFLDVIGLGLSSREKVVGQHWGRRFKRGVTNVH